MTDHLGADLSVKDTLKTIDGFRFGSEEDEPAAKRMKFDIPVALALVTSAMVYFLSKEHEVDSDSYTLAKSRALEVYNLSKEQKWTDSFTKKIIAKLNVEDDD
jgi:hypothetical protein